MKRILTINVGSSSIRVITFRTNGTNVDLEPISSLDVAEVSQCFEGADKVSAIAHRVVHAGVVQEDAALLDDGITSRIRNGIPLAPNHNQKVLNTIQAAAKRLQSVPQIAVFDSAFHRTIPLPAALYPVPYDWYVRFSVKRLGFHGLSHRYASERAAQILGYVPRHLVVAHIGNGASLAAIREGVSVDTTMGFTPLEGLMMGQRSGTVDPGILLYLMQKERLTPPEMERLISSESGLLGTSGVSADFREILDLRIAGHERATLAFDMYVHRVRRGIGEMAAAMNGIDALVFTGGVGEHSSEIRRAVCSGLSSFGIKIEEARNEAVCADATVSRSDSPVSVLVVTAKENWMMARAAAAILYDDDSRPDPEL